VSLKAQLLALNASGLFAGRSSAQSNLFGAIGIAESNRRPPQPCVGSPDEAWTEWFEGIICVVKSRSFSSAMPLHLGETALTLLLAAYIAAQ